MGDVVAATLNHFSHQSSVVGLLFSRQILIPCNLLAAFLLKLKAES